jgi:predicted GIY-YIG superfamily endonuclease
MWGIFNLTTMFYTYILRSAVNGHLYKGSTENIEPRIEQHNAGMVNYTKNTDHGNWFISKHIIQDPKRWQKRNFSKLVKEEIG